jgi:predicted RNA-binding Zn ribbon-like protein
MSMRTALWKQRSDGFEWLGLCLRFANTADWHASAHPKETLSTYRDLVTWGVSGGLISPGETARLMRRASSQSGRARAALARAVEAREVIYRIMSGLAHGRAPAARNLTALNRALASTLRRSRLVSDGSAQGTGRFAWEITGRVDDFDRILWPVLKSTADLLTSPELRRVKECADDRGCGFLFLDRSKNLSRRWCSMKSCGNRAKVLMYNRRRRST